MDFDEVKRAFDRGQIEQPTYRFLSNCWRRARQQCTADSPVYRLLSQVELVAAEKAKTLPAEMPAADTPPPAEALPLPFARSELRPGLSELFQALHHDSVRPPLTAAVLRQVDPQVQVHSLVRLQTQPALAKGIEQIWRSMGSWFERGILLIPFDRPELRSPPTAERDALNGVDVTQLPLDQRLAELFETDCPDQILAVIRRGMERMADLFVDQFLASEQGQDAGLQDADELLTVLRGTSLHTILCNGFTSGAADVVNPLHCLVQHLLPTRAADLAEPDWQQAVLAAHLDFVTALATFNLEGLVEVEHLLRQPASHETQQFARRWSSLHPDLGGKGCPWDCNYDKDYFAVRYAPQDRDQEIPLLDFRGEALDIKRPQGFGGQVLRMGCPSLGPVHRQFTAALGRAYCSAVLPSLLRVSASQSTRSATATTSVSDPPEYEQTLLQPGHREVRYEYTPVLCEILQHLRASLVVTTYQAGKLLVLGTHAGKLRISFLDFDQPMGVAVGQDRLAIGTRRQIHFLKSAHDTAASITPSGSYDGCFLPRTSFYTGAIHGHDLAFGSEGLWIVNTLFSCLCTIHEAYSFVPRWRPPFITDLADEDRCHLNGLAMEQGIPRYVTAIAATDTKQGWRDHKIGGGCVIDVSSGGIVATGLAMPHSPRLQGGRLWVLNSGHGSLGTMDLSDGRYETVETMPGYTRGLAMAGQFAFVGLSKIRETAIFGGVPIAQDHTSLRCGVGVIDLLSGRTVAVFQFLSGVEEIFGVDLIPGVCSPFISGASEDQQQRDVWIVPPLPAEGEG